MGGETRMERVDGIKKGAYDDVYYPDLRHASAALSCLGTLQAHL